MLCVQSLFARDAFVMLSGGDSEMDDNYSQYLQARAMTAFFQKSYASNSVWVFFGAGNAEGSKPVICDVYRVIKRDGNMVDTWLPGTLPHNRAATREEFLPALRNEILPTVADGGTLYLFVGDHGSRTHGKNAESVITLWGMFRDAEGEHGWTHKDNEELGVSELRGILAAGIGRGRVVFCMTQCHSGGFHYLAIPHEMTPETSWFTTVPEWAKRPRPQQVALRAAGYAATDEFSLASGCDPSPDPDEWAGYERYLPESLLGLNLFTLQRTGGGVKSFAEAHAAAMLVDRTIDKPYSTSEQYLERWADLIEKRLTRESALTPKVKKAIADYQRAVNGATPSAADVSFKERQALFRGFVETLAKQNDGSRELLFKGTRTELEDAITPKEVDMNMDMSAPSDSGPRWGRRGGFGARRRLWTDLVQPSWQAAVNAGEATNLPAEAVDFEKYVLAREDEGANYFFGGDALLREEVFWQAGYGDPQNMNAAKAEAIATWAAGRRDAILAWAKTNGRQPIRAAAQRLEQTLETPADDPAAAAQLVGVEKKMTAAERTLFYRRVLAAWNFLLTVNDKTALTHLHELTELERTPLPPPM